MNTLAKHPKTMLVIVTEAVLEKNLLRDVQQFGAQSWTVGEVHSRGGREGIRDGDWEADRTIEIRVIADEPVADRIAAHVLERYANNYGLTLYFSAVQVLRPERY